MKFTLVDAVVLFILLAWQLGWIHPTGLPVQR